MATHRYRVLKELPWIEGGRPVPFGWEGGRVVVYQPGDTVEVDDRELDGVYHRIEAIDDGGRSVLEAARAKANQPAQTIAVADLHPRMVEWMSRAQDERLRDQGRLAELCLRMIDRGDAPSREDLAAALEAPEPPPPELLAYVAGTLRGKWRKSGPKNPPRTTFEDLSVQACYWFVVRKLERHFARNRQKGAPVKRRAAEEVAAAFGLSVRTVQRIVAPRPLTKDRPK